MTKEEYEKKIAELQAQIDELRNERIDETNSAPPTPPHPRWEPSNGDTYYMIDTCGGVCIQDWTGINNEIDKSRLSCGNVFKTRAEAEFAAERRNVLAEMQEWAGKWDDKYILRCDEKKKIETYSQISPHKSYGEMRFATKEDAENCIGAVGEDRIKKYYFLIPEV